MLLGMFRFTVDFTEIDNYVFFRYMKCDLEMFELSELGCQFDVILLEPPLQEYQRAQGAVFDKYWDWDEVELEPDFNFYTCTQTL